MKLTDIVYREMEQEFRKLLSTSTDKPSTAIDREHFRLAQDVESLKRQLSLYRTTAYNKLQHLESENAELRARIETLEALIEKG